MPKFFLNPKVHFRPVQNQTLGLYLNHQRQSINRNETKGNDYSKGICSLPTKHKIEF